MGLLYRQALRQASGILKLTQSRVWCYYPDVLNDLFHGFLDLVYPPICPACKEFSHARFSEGKLCPPCLAKIDFNRPPFCLKCSRHFVPLNKSSLCRDCRYLKPEFDFAWCVCRYTPVVRQLIHQFKYGQKTYIRHIFRNLIVEFCQRYQLDIHQFDCVIPIPLFPSRQRERGYNQSQILSEEICRHYSLVLNTHWLKRKRPTQPQVDLKRQERIVNMAQAFTVSKRHNLHGKTILLVDDLITTGATASEAAKTLKEAGAQRVGFLALAGAF